MMISWGGYRVYSWRSSYPIWNIEYRKSTFIFLLILLFSPCLPSITGSVAVYNVTDKSEKPTYQSTAKTGKHTDPVWQVGIWTAHYKDLHCSLSFWTLVTFDTFEKASTSVAKFVGTIGPFPLPQFNVEISCYQSGEANQRFGGGGALFYITSNVTVRSENNRLNF